MKTISKLSVLFLFTLMFFSCGSVSVSSDYDHSVDFSKYKTFSFYQLNITGTQSVNQLNQNRIINDIKANLISKGFTEATSKPDLMVNATTVTSVQQQYDANTNYYGAGGMYRPYGWGGGYYGGGMANTTVSVQNYTNGSLVIDIVQASDNTLLWTGTGTKDITSPSDNPDQAIQEAVTKIMASFPPGVKQSN